MKSESREYYSVKSHFHEFLRKKYIYHEELGTSSIDRDTVVSDSAAIILFYNLLLKNRLTDTEIKVFNELEEKEKTIKEFLKEYNLKEKELIYLKDELKYFEKVKNISDKIINYGFYILYVFFIICLLLWYFRYQKYQDKIIILSLKKLEKEVIDTNDNILGIKTKEKKNKSDVKNKQDKDVKQIKTNLKNSGAK